jgi:hypothetical protein
MSMVISIGRVLLYHSTPWYNWLMRVATSASRATQARRQARFAT